ncbi:hypothetical protein ACOMHN_012420 [Nucella lapillus]
MAELNQSTEEMQWWAPPRLPLFSGESDDGPAEDFLQEVNRVLAAYQMANRVAIEYIIRHLRGNARREVLLRDREDTNTPEKVTNILQAVFGDGRRVTTLLSIFYNRQQQPEESILEYSHVLRGLQRTLHMKNAESLPADLLRDRFMEGLRTPALKTELRRLVRRDPQTTFFEVRDNALRWLWEDQEDQDQRRVTGPELTLMKQKVLMLDSSIRSMQESLKLVQGQFGNRIYFKKRKRRRRKRKRHTLKARDSNPLLVKETPARGSNPHGLGLNGPKPEKNVDKTIQNPLPDSSGIEDEAQESEWVLQPTSPKPVTTGRGSSPAREGKEGKINVFRLSDFEGEVAEAVTRSRADCREHRLERTKGCHLYALSRPGGSHLRMVVALGKRLLVFSWKHSAAWSVWCPSVDVDIVDSFTFLRELQCGDVPQLVTLIEGIRGDNQICVGYKNQFDLINEKNGDTLQLYSVEASKVNLVSALDIYEDDEAELILCYNHVSHFQKLREETCHDFDFHWNSEPKSIVCAFPYVMSFTPDTIEIRLIINGNLVHTTTMPDLTLITSKCDIYFASSAASSASPKEKKSSKDSHFSPPPSPSAKTGCTSSSSTIPSLNLFKIPLSCLSGGQMAGGAVGGASDPKTSSNPGGGGTPGAATLLAPVVSNGSGERSPGPFKRSPLIRSKRVGVGGGVGATAASSSSSSSATVAAVTGGGTASLASLSLSSGLASGGGGGGGGGGGAGGGGGSTLPVEKVSVLMGRFICSLTCLACRCGGQVSVLMGRFICSLTCLACRCGGQVSVLMDRFICSLTCLACRCGGQVSVFDCLD